MWTTSDFMILTRLISDIEFHQKMNREQHGSNSTTLFNDQHISIIGNQILRLIDWYMREYEYEALGELEVDVVNTDDVGFYVQLVPIHLID